jgi:hypothetical protein
MPGVMGAPPPLWFWQDVSEVLMTATMASADERMCFIFFWAIKMMPRPTWESIIKSL